MLGGKLPRTRLAWMGLGVFIVLLAVAGVIAYRSMAAPAPPSRAFSEFLGDVQANRVKHVTVDADTLTYRQVDGTQFATIAPQGYVATNAAFISNLTDRGIRIDVSRSEPSKAGSYGAFAVGLLFFGFAGLAMYPRRHRARAQPGKSPHHRPRSMSPSRSPTWPGSTKRRTRFARSSTS